MSTKYLIEQVRPLPVSKKEVWVMGQKTLDISIQELGEHERPELLVCLSPKKGVIGSNVIARETSDAEVLQWAFECMTSPMTGSPRRPGTVTLTSGELTHLRDALEQLGIKVEIAASSHPAIDGLAAEFERSVGAPGLPPYAMETDYEDTGVVNLFFESAAEYYKQKPWKCFEHELPLKIDVWIDDKQVTYWAVIIGTCGESCGLSLYKSYDDLAELLDADGAEEALDVIQSIWSMAFNFMNVKDIGVPAQDELFANDWTLAHKSAYPSALVTDPEDKRKLRLPTSEEMEYLSAVTYALAVLFKDNRRQIKAHLNRGMVGSVLTYNAALFREDDEVPVSICLPAPEYLEDLAEFLNDPFGEEDGDLFGMIGNKPRTG